MDTPRLLSHSLSNGLHIVGESIPESESVAICFAVLAGSRDETGSIPLGTAHALEHMLFKGTQERGSLHLLEAFTRIGAEVNAATTSAATIYYVQVLSEFLEPAFALLTEMIAVPLLDGESWENERATILNELAMYEEQPLEALQTLMRQAYFGSHSLAHDVLGTHESLVHLSNAQTHCFWYEHYRPNRMIVSVVGRFDEVSLYSMVERYCGVWLPGSQPCYEEPRVGVGQRMSALCNPRLQLQYLMVGIPAIPTGTPGYKAALLGARALWKRLYWAIVHKGLAEDHDVDLWAADIDILGNANLLTMQASCDLSQAKEVLNIMHQELEHLFQKGIPEEELQRIKIRYMSGLVLDSEERLHRAWELMEWAIEGQISSVAEEVSRIELITCEQVMDALVQGVVGARPILVAVGPLDHTIIEELGRNIFN